MTQEVLGNQAEARAKQIPAIEPEHGEMRYWKQRTAQVPDQKYLTHDASNENQPGVKRLWDGQT
ncbi:hypothetical protein PG996_007166 [Apiospora saccharicola]|uniref:Uncharacterized protein n=1 Tax=Apiospora saccharicola TaxID=335842 RepID=A0ABR1VA22_9PEZI